MLRIFHGGGVRAYQRRDEEISRLGHEVHLLVPKAFRELPTLTIAQVRNDSIRVTPIGLYGLRRNPFFFYNPFRVAYICRTFKPQVIDVHEEPYSLAAASILLARFISCVKCEIVFRSSQNEFKSYPFPFSFIQWMMFKTSTEAYVPSEQARRVLQQKKFTGRVSVVGNGVLAPTTPPIASSRSTRLEVVCVGRLIERKGVQDLVEAVVGSQLAINLTIVGSGPMENQLRSIVEGRQHAGGDVDFKGQLALTKRQRLCAGPT
ncbi:glycosyl transferase group 1 [Arthrobacter sp. Hiyo4]|nr:glycosyl transferase group 1 [Arthrobacter sp. Hiyo4]